MNDFRQLYEELILDHNRSPRNFGRKPEPISAQELGHNPLCGDEFTIYLQVEDGLIKDVSFDGQGCAISVASTSMMTEAVKNKPLAEVRKLFERVQSMITDAEEMDPPQLEALGKLQVLAGVRAFPMRVKCATMSWHALNSCLRKLSHDDAP